VFVDTGWHSSDVDELMATVKRLEALYEIAVGNIAFNSDELDESGVRAMIERHYEDTKEGLVTRKRNRIVGKMMQEDADIATMIGGGK
jgi:predicted TIM-barrel fold metal-dependent hydrolase